MFTLQVYCTNVLTMLHVTIFWGNIPQIVTSFRREALKSCLQGFFPFFCAQFLLFVDDFVIFFKPDFTWFAQIQKLVSSWNMSTQFTDHAYFQPKSSLWLELKMDPVKLATRSKSPNTPNSILWFFFQLLAQRPPLVGITVTLTYVMLLNGDGFFASSRQIVQKLSKMAGQTGCQSTETANLPTKLPIIILLTRIC